MPEKKVKYLTKTEALIKIQRFCAYQDRCHSEVRSKLLSLGVYGDTLEELMADLIEERFLDEERFAKSFARGKFRIKGWGRIRITQELKRRKITPYCIRKGLAEIDETDYTTQLQTLLERKSEQWTALPLALQRQKLAQYALQRGYEPTLVWELIPSILPTQD